MINYITQTTILFLVTPTCFAKAHWGEYSDYIIYIYLTESNLLVSLPVCYKWQLSTKKVTMFECHGHCYKVMTVLPPTSQPHYMCW